LPEEVEDKQGSTQQDMACVKEVASYFARAAETQVGFGKSPGTSRYKRCSMAQTTGLMQGQDLLGSIYTTCEAFQTAT
jgi:hypothetical protein